MTGAGAVQGLVTLLPLTRVGLNQSRCTGRDGWRDHGGGGMDGRTEERREGWREGGIMEGGRDGWTDGGRDGGIMERVGEARIGSHCFPKIPLRGHMNLTNQDSMSPNWTRTNFGQRKPAVSTLSWSMLHEH